MSHLAQADKGQAGNGGAQQAMDHAKPQGSNPRLIEEAASALDALRIFRRQAGGHLRRHLTVEGRIDTTALARHQLAAHGYAWLATYETALEQMLDWAHRRHRSGTLSVLETLIIEAAFAEYLAQCLGGIPLAQGETVRPGDYFANAAIGPLAAAAAPFLTPGRGEDRTREIAEAIDAETATPLGDPALDDDDLVMMQAQIRRFTEDHVSPHAHEWHRRDQLIPLDVIARMAELGVFGITIPGAHGGLGLGKMALCVVTEELSRGFLGVGSLGTRAELASELIANHGTEDQKARFLAGISKGQVLATALFTEPDTGSDLSSVRCRADYDKSRGTFAVTGSKTWSTHGARSDMMILLARTGKTEDGYRGLSLLLAEKPRGREDDPFPAAGMSGTEIPVLGYRGMKEYEISFDGFEVAGDNLLGGTPGNGFKQLMSAMEAARIQTAARAVGVAENALELALAYARERRQFGAPLFSFPRVFGKIAWMAVETMIARQLTYLAARAKDSGKRCDIEAGMAKLLAARVAWSNADNAVQIHGGNGFALEYPVSRVLCDARILAIFEGTAEIQAQIIARGLLQQEETSP